MRQGKTYLVKDLDLSAKTAWCQEADLKYYTKTRDYTDIKVLGGDIVCLSLHRTTSSRSYLPFSGYYARKYRGRRTSIGLDSVRAAISH